MILNENNFCMFEFENLTLDESKLDTVLFDRVKQNE